MIENELFETLRQNCLTGIPGWYFSGFLTQNGIGRALRYEVCKVRLFRASEKMAE